MKLRRAVDAYNGGVEVDSHHFDEEQDQDPHYSDKSDPESKLDPIPH